MMEKRSFDVEESTSKTKPCMLRVERRPCLDKPIGASLRRWFNS